MPASGFAPQSPIPRMDATMRPSALQPSGADVGLFHDHRLSPVSGLAAPPRTGRTKPYGGPHPGARTARRYSPPGESVAVSTKRELGNTASVRPRPVCANATTRGRPLAYGGPHSAKSSAP